MYRVLETLKYVEKERKEINKREGVQEKQWEIISETWEAVEV